MSETVGSYRIVGSLGVGGMGTVYRAEHVLLGRAAAVKLLNPDMTSNRDVVSRFFNEARATSAIKHPGIVEIFDFGYTPEGRAFIVMELLEGEPLTHRMRARGGMEEPEAVLLMRDVCSALAAAHAKGIVHRDLKPDNIFIVPDPETGERTKILDFGIAKLTDIGLASSATKTGSVMGTPTYMSPEQCRGSGDVDHRADLYSIGCMLYEMISGRPPFVRTGAGELIGSHLFVEPDPLSRHAQVSPELEALVMSLLAKDPNQRVQTARDLGNHLLGIAQAAGVSVRMSAASMSIPPQHFTGAHFTPAHHTPAHYTPAHYTPAHHTPAPHTPAPHTPAHFTPAHSAPAPHTPAHYTPAHLTPADRTHADHTPAHFTPAHRTPAPPTPAHRTPTPLSSDVGAIASEPTTLSGAASEAAPLSSGPMGTKKSRLPLVIGALGLVVAVGIGGVFAMRGGGDAGRTDSRAASPPARPVGKPDKPDKPGNSPDKPGANTADKRVGDTTGANIADEPGRNNPGANITDQPVGDTADKPVANTVDNPSGNTVDKPAANATNQPGANTSDKPVANTTDKTVGDTADKPGADKPVSSKTVAGNSADKPGASTADKPANTTDKPVANTTNKPGANTTDKPGANKPDDTTTPKPDKPKPRPDKPKPRPNSDLLETDL